MADSSIDPPTANITTVDNVTYTFTDDIYEPIIVQRSNVIVDGNRYTLQGYGSGNGFSLSDVNNVTIRNTNIKNFSSGIYLNSSSDNTVSGNNITNNGEGFSLFHSSSHNIFSENSITNNEENGIYLDSSSHNSVFFGNNITNNYFGVYLGSSDNEFYHNNFVDNIQSVPILTSDCANFWDDGYPSGGNYWSDYTSLDYYHGLYQDELGSDGIGDTPYVINANNTDRYPFMNPWGVASYNVTIKAYCDCEGVDVSVDITMNGSLTAYTTPHTFTKLTGTHTFTVPNTDSNGHPFKQWNTGQTTTTITVSINGTYTAHYGIKTDIVVTNVTPSKTVVGQGHSVSINVTVENQGDYVETFNVTTYANEITIATLTDITFVSGNSTTVTFTWNTTGVTKGNYTITAKATQLPGETYTTDNTLTDGWVIVAMVGDITGPDGYPDGKCDMRDIGVVAKLFGVNHPDPKYNPNCDINNDLKIDMKDIGVVAKNFGKTDP